MKQVLLSSVKLVRGVVGIADNVADEYIVAALSEAQDMGLRRLLGSALTDKLQQLVAGGQMDAAVNKVYKELADKAQYYLAYQAAAKLTVKTSFKISNFGVVQTADENIQAARMSDVLTVREDYQATADSYCKELQGFVLENRAQLPELTANDCNQIKAHLKDAYTGGFWLGGPRGKVCR